MVNASFVSSLLLAFAASHVDAVHPVLPAVDTCSSTEAAGQEYLKLSRLAISEQPRTTSQFVVEKEQVADNPNRIPFIPRPALLTNVQHLIVDAIESTRADTKEVFVSSGTDTRWKSQVKADSTGEEILKQLGFYPVPTPATGNCQYYAVAMSLLDLRFDTAQHIEALEQLTRHLKEGIAEAIRHGYEVEFPHDIRQTILVSTQLDVDGQEIMIPETEEESNRLFQEYIRAIARSPSTTSSFLPVELWGTEVTLRMMAKLLRQPIFVVIAPYGLQTTIDFQVYKPERVIMSRNHCEMIVAACIDSMAN